VTFTKFPFSSGLPFLSTLATFPQCAATIGTLAPGRSTTYGCRTAGASADVTNILTATGISPGGITVSARDYSVVVVLGAAPPSQPPPPEFTG
jgi:hypothetical protein